MEVYFVARILTINKLQLATSIYNNKKGQPRGNGIALFSRVEDRVRTGDLLNHNQAL